MSLAFGNGKLNSSRLFGYFYKAFERRLFVGHATKWKLTHSSDTVIPRDFELDHRRIIVIDWLGPQSAMACPGGLLALPLGYIERCYK